MIPAIRKYGSVMLLSSSLFEYLRYILTRTVNLVETTNNFINDQGSFEELVLENMPNQSDLIGDIYLRERYLGTNKHQIFFLYFN